MVFRRGDAGNVEFAALVLEPGELRADADGRLDAVEVGPPGAEIARVPPEPEALPVHPLL